MKMMRRDWLRWLPLGAVGLGLAGAASGQGRGGRADHYSTDRGAERVEALRLVTGSPYLFTTLYSLRVPGLRAGDVVQAHAQFEATNDLGYNAMFAHAMLVHQEEVVIDHANERPRGGKVLCEYAGENITPDMHHGFRTLVGSYQAEEDGDAYLSVLIYAASTRASDGDTLEIHRGYGGLRAIVFRNS